MVMIVLHLICFSPSPPILALASPSCSPCAVLCCLRGFLGGGVRFPLLVPSSPSLSVANRSLRWTLFRPLFLPFSPVVWCMHRHAHTADTPFATTPFPPRSDAQATAENITRLWHRQLGRPRRGECCLPSWFCVSVGHEWARACTCWACSKTRSPCTAVPKPPNLPLESNPLCAIHGSVNPWAAERGHQRVMHTADPRKPSAK